MKWQSEGLILGIRQHGENSAVVSLITHDYGRHAGVVRLSSKNRSTIQIGNFVQANWSGRLPEHLGSFSFELIHSPLARIMSDSLRLTAMGACLNLLDRLLADRHPYPSIYAMACDLMDKLTNNHPRWLQDYAVFELKLLEILGFGLDLSRCAATGSQENLAYISPKSGCAVSREAGIPYSNKLFEIPKFIQTGLSTSADQTDIIGSLKISGYFLAKYFFNGILPDRRSHFADLLLSS